PIRLFCAKWALLKGAKQVIFIDKKERLVIAKQKIPEVEFLDYECNMDDPTRLQELRKGHGIEAGEASVLRSTEQQERVVCRSGLGKTKATKKLRLSD
ncbi:unnamed protein product, partial [Tilletia controversa]